MLLLLAQGLLNKIVNNNINIVIMSERREDISFYDFHFAMDGICW